MTYQCYLDLKERCDQLWYHLICHYKQAYGSQYVSRLQSDYAISIDTIESIVHRHDFKNHRI